MCHPLVSLTLAVVMAAALANAQVVSGRVLGFDGEPAARAVVELRLEGVQGFQVLTDPGGRFTRSCEGKLAALRVQHEGVVIPFPFAAGKTTDLEVSFANVAHFTLRGRVLLPDGAPAAGVEVLCRDADGVALVSVATDARGLWSVRLGQPAREVVADSLGLAVAEAGPFGRDEVLSIDLRFVRRRRSRRLGGDPCRPGGDRGLRADVRVGNRQRGVRVHTLVACSLGRRSNVNSRRPQFGARRRSR